MLANPNADGAACAGVVDVDAFPTSAGTIDFGFGVQELDVSCRPAGLHFDGKGKVTSACCENVVDVDFPIGGFTFRLVVRSDWQ
jgi:hypothetical protein